MIHYLPKFWYHGSKRWGTPSDLKFIQGKLQRLSSENQKIASEQYDEIYKHHHNRGEWRKARELANQMLNDMANEYGITLKDYQNLKAANDDQKWINSQIEKLKQAQKTAKPHIEFKERRRA